MSDLLAGGTAVACAAIGVFFLRYWARTRDRLFVMFAIAFWIYGANRVALSIAGDADEDRVWLYGLRFVAFVIILVAIVDKNRQSRASPKGSGELSG
jgi:hypothetical protein